MGLVGPLHVLLQRGRICTLPRTGAEMIRPPHVGRRRAEGQTRLVRARLQPKRLPRNGGKVTLPGRTAVWLWPRHMSTVMACSRAMLDATSCNHSH